MNEIMTDLWPFLLTAFIGAIGWQWRENYSLKVRVAVLETTVENLQTTLESIQKRQDSHSKKQDDILNLVQEIKVEMVKQIGAMSSEIEVISADVKNINRVLSIDDGGEHKSRIRKTK